jgi:hypothetical protein
MRLIALLRDRVRAEDGFTMVVAMGAMVLVLVLSVAAYTAVQGDLPLTSHDSLQKQAYSAAQAGIQSYLFDLDTNSEYWAQCVPTSNPNGINQVGSTTNTRTVPGSSNQTYAIELLPANGYASCNANNPVNTMIKAEGTGAGELRIRSTGYAKGYNGGGQTTVSRSVIATLRESSFLDNVWFTVYETSDPVVQVANAYNASIANGTPQGGDNTIEPPYQCTVSTPAPTNCGSNYNTAITGATKQCGQYRYPPPGGNSTTNAPGYNRLTVAQAIPGYPGAFYTYYNSTTKTTTAYQCDTISFISADTINGPFQTNDQANACGTPTFGRNSNDHIIFGYSTGNASNWAPGGYVEGQGCSGAPTFKGTVYPPGQLTPPPSNAALKTIAGASYTGTTCLNLTSSGIQVAQPGVSPNAGVQSCEDPNLSWATTIPYPSNGVLYVSNGACSLTYDVENVSYTGYTGCGTVYVHGQDWVPLTIGAEDDIVIDGNLTYGSPSSGPAPMLGLVANNFVRVYHPVGKQPLGTNTSPCTSTSTNVNTSISSGMTIDAMMLSLQHSIILDQYNCGAKMGTLTVSGGLAQEYRGTVGTTSNGTVVNGYAKNYNYDDRLRYEEPPHFINPVQGSWRVQSEEECNITASNTAC